MSKIRRGVTQLGGILITLLGASILIFGALYLAPGDPLTVIVGGPEKLTPENIAYATAQYHLDQPFLVRYVLWLGDVVTGDLGRSFVYNVPVLDLLASRIGTTLSLTAYAGLFMLAIALPLGVWSGRRRGRADQLTLVGTTLAASIPSFVAGIVLVALFGVALRWFPVSGAGEGFIDGIYHLTLPAIALAIGALAVLTRVTRQSTIEASARDHVEVARMRGLPEGYILTRHIFRNAVPPVVTMVGVILASMLAGTVVVETVFGLSGIGSLLIDAIDTSDLPVTQAVLMLMVIAYIVATLLTEVVNRIADPRLRERTSRS